MLRSDTVLFFNDVFDMCPAPSSVHQFYIYTADVDAAHKRAVAAGATSEAEPKSQFWGGRLPPHSAASRPPSSPSTPPTAH